jgi:hypothetical protein
VSTERWDEIACAFHVPSTGAVLHNTAAWCSPGPSVLLALIWQAIAAALDNGRDTGQEKEWLAEHRNPRFGSSAVTTRAVVAAVTLPTVRSGKEIVKQQHFSDLQGSLNPWPIKQAVWTSGSRRTTNCH